MFYFTCLFALCTDFTMFRFASYIFLLNLVQYILTSRMQRTQTALGSFFDSLSFLSSCCFYIFYIFCIFPVYYPLAMSVLCLIIIRRLCGIHVVLCFGLVYLYMWFLKFLLLYSYFCCCFFQSLTVIENVVYLFFKRRVFCLWERVPGLGE